MSNANPYFIDKDINILTGEQALEALQKENDSKFLTKESGVIKVSAERWKLAQECERNHWLKKGIKTGNDRNDYHYMQFNQYKDISSIEFNSMLEIGCGPFTNSRIVAKVCKINSCSLLDPLILDYLKHPFCYYNNNFLYSEYFSILGKIVRKTVPKLFKLYLNLLSKKTKVNKILAAPAEQIALDTKYDLISMINVIEHCYDAELVFQNILNIGNKGSYFIFEDKFYDHQLIEESLKTGYDAAHPLKVDRKIIEKFLYNNFETVYKRVQTNSYNFEGDTIVWDDIYFIGKRK